MRIISGTHKGRKITAPKHLDVRPTTDFAKEALFNILVNRFDFEHITILDLFAGIGGISFEFASRGVKQVHAVELQRANFKFIDKTIHELGFENQIQLYLKDVFSFLKQPRGNSYSIIFADPPFNFDASKYETLIDLIFQNQWLNNEGIFILEHSANMRLESNPNFSEHRKYGNVHFSFFSKVD